MFNGPIYIHLIINNSQCASNISKGPFHIQRCTSDSIDYVYVIEHKQSEQYNGASEMLVKIQYIEYLVES
jgi:hypothetical protein